MSEELDDLDSPEEDQTPEAGGAGPTLADLKKLRSENKGLRDRLRKAEERELTTQFGVEIVELLPEEVTDHERRVALAEKLAAKFQASSGTQTDQAPEDAPEEEPSPEEKALAAVNRGSSAGHGEAKLLTADEIQTLGLSDPAAAFKALQAQVDPATGQLREP